jgi:hypothetical protein
MSIASCRPSRPCGRANDKNQEQAIDFARSEIRKTAKSSVRTELSDDVAHSRTLKNLPPSRPILRHGRRWRASSDEL